MKTLALAFALILATAIFPKNTYASTPAASSAALTSEIKPKEAGDLRVQALENTLNKYNSILKPYAKDYVVSADKYGVDWKLLPSIAGLESTFGRAYIPGTYNVYGWGSGRIYFDSWEDGIDEINSKLRSNYMDKWGAEDVWEIGPIYAESPTWSVRVNSFMNEINNEYLAISTNESLRPNL
jgi:hypothetical protein